MKSTRAQLSAIHRPLEQLLEQAATSPALLDAARALIPSVMRLLTTETTVATLPPPPSRELALALWFAAASLAAATSTLTLVPTPEEVTVTARA